MKRINNHIVIASIVRAFFKYFVTGIIESKVRQGSSSGPAPKAIKLVMLDHYGNGSKVFNKEAFFAFFKMNYEREEMEHCLRTFVTESTTDMELMRFACRTDEFYNVMVSEYKRNFENLLCGRIDPPEGNAYAAGEGPQLGMTDAETAESLITEIATNAYKLGRNAGVETDKEKK